MNPGDKFIYYGTTGFIIGEVSAVRTIDVADPKRGVWVRKYEIISTAGIKYFDDEIHEVLREMTPEEIERHQRFCQVPMKKRFSISQKNWKQLQGDIWKDKIFDAFKDKE